MSEVEGRSGKRLEPPFVVEEYWGGGGVEWCIKDSRGVWLVTNVGSKEDAEAICEAVNSHNAHLADIDRLLDKLRPFDRAVRDRSEKKRYSLQTAPTLLKDYISEEDIKKAGQTYAELREKYKEKKDDKKL